MKTWRRVGAAAAAAALLATAACHSSTGAAAAAPTRGGTLTVYLSTHAISNLDPQGISWAVDASFSRIINRTLTATTADGKLIPDLATDTGRPKDNNTVWDFTLKRGLKWQDGSPVTCNDVKYGIERRFSKVIGDYQGLPYPLIYLKDNPTPYQGPFDGKSLDSIQCLDQSNVEFHLNQAAGDFGYTVSVNTFAPVKVGSDGDDKAAYNFDPTSDGPYKIDAANTIIDKKDFEAPSLTQLTLVRNPFWSPTTDSLRKAYPDKIVAKWALDNSQTTNDLINSTGDFANSISLDGDASPNFVQQIINDPGLSARTLQATTTGVRYFAINTKRITNLNCRKALEYGFDKRSFRFVLGGSTAGELATSMIPPGIPAHEDFDLYETADFPDGDYTKAAKMITDNHCKTSISVAYQDTPIYHQLISTVVEAYQRIGVEVNQVPIDHSEYQQKIADPKNKYDLIVSGWVPDWPNGSGVIPTLFDGAQTEGDASQNLNYSFLNDPAINSAIKAANGESKLQVQYRLWGDLDRQVMAQAAVIPVLYIGALRLYGSNVRGVVMAQQFGMPDLATMGLGSAPASDS